MNLFKSFARHCHAKNWTLETHLCGHINRQHVGQKVVVCGWIQHTRLDNKFILLRDRSGHVQLMNDDLKLLKEATLESCLCIEGLVIERPEGQANKKIPNGDIEIQVESVKSLNISNVNLPMYIKSHNEADEYIRLKHRYLDLRNLWLQKNLKLRSDLTLKVRNFMADSGFIEVETPTLFRRTPGGAREFLVPTHHKDQFYSLVQSPQQFKQLLMVGGVGKYFQIARCYRDEGSRPDRQPEFTQIDIEMAFTDAQKVQDMTEALVKDVWPDQLSEEAFPRLTYNEIMSKYGSDKPDLRIDNEIQHLGFHEGRFAKAMWFRNDQFGSQLSKSALKKLEKDFKGDSDLIVIGHQKNSELKQNVIKLLPPTTKLNPDDVGFIVLGPQESKVLDCLGKIRSYFCQNLLTLDPKSLKFLWVVDFPMFLPNEETGQLEAAHHPFTRPRDEDIDLLEKRPDLVRAQHYDLVLNGQEIAGGSMRIHEPKLQKYILENILREDTADLSHMLEALKYGCPPHGGIALGLDRLMMIICGAKSIRDVIAFPKTSTGKDIMSGAPASVSAEEKSYYHLQD